MRILVFLSVVFLLSGAVPKRGQMSAEAFAEAFPRSADAHAWRGLPEGFAFLPAHERLALLPAHRLSQADLSKSFYVAREGDTFKKIAQAVWGDSLQWPYLYARNQAQFGSPDDVEAGALVRLSNTETMPHLIMGASGTITSLTITGSDFSSAAALWLHAYSFAYSSTQYVIKGGCEPYKVMPNGNVNIGSPDGWANDCWQGYDVYKIEVRIVNASGASSWVPVRNATTTMHPRDHRYSGGIEGPAWYARIRMNLSQFSRQLVNGPNTIQFRFNRERDELSSGARLVAIAVLPSSVSGVPDRETAMAASLIDQTTFTYADPISNPAGPLYYGDVIMPSTGQPATAADIAAGQSLYRQENILVAWPGGPPMRAACVDCHAENFRLLNVMGAENHAFVTRARDQHGLTNTQAHQIAAFARAQQRALRENDGDMPVGFGRMWCAPYQPGSINVATGLAPSESDPFYWVMGSCTVYDSYKDVMRDLFPNGSGGIDYAADGSYNWKHIAPSGMLNLIEVGLTHPLPDANEWFPRVHAKDGSALYPELPDAWYEQAGSPLRKAIQSRNFNEIQKQLDEWFRYSVASQNNAKESRYARKPCHDGTAKMRQDCYIKEAWVTVPSAKLGYKQWMLTKAWELLHTNRLENAGPLGPAYLHWPGNHQRIMFDVADHINTAYVYDHDKTDWSTHLDCAWYIGGPITTGGLKQGTVNRPVDWKYTWQHCRGASVSGPSFEVENAISYFLLLQNGSAPYAHPEDGNWRHVTPGWATGDPGKSRFTSALGDVDDRRFLTAHARAFLAYLTQIPPSQWPRGEQGKRVRVGSVQTYPLPPKTTTSGFVAKHVGLPSNTKDGYHTQLFTYVDMLYKRGVTRSVVDSLARYLNHADMLPAGNWEQFFCTGASCSEHGPMPLKVLDYAAPSPPLSPGQSYTIRWTSSGSIASVKLSYQKTGGAKTTIVDATANDGQHVWTVPPLESGSYRILVEDASDPTVTTSSDLFTITSGSEVTLAVVSPTGGETFTAGERVLIETSVTGQAPLVTYELHDGSGLVSTIAASLAHAGLYEWVVDAPPGTGYFIVVRSGAASASSGTFDIAAPPGGETVIYNHVDIKPHALTRDPLCTTASSDEKVSGGSGPFALRGVFDRGCAGGVTLSSYAQGDTVEVEIGVPEGDASSVAGFTLRSSGDSSAVGLVVWRTGAGRLIVTYRPQVGIRSSYLALSDSLNPSYVLADPSAAITLRLVQKSSGVEVEVVEGVTVARLGEAPLSPAQLTQTPFAGVIARSRQAGQLTSVHFPDIKHRRSN